MYSGFSRLKRENQERNMEQIAVAKERTEGAEKTFEHLIEGLTRKPVEPESTKEKIRQQFMGELEDGGLIEYRGQAYVRFDETDLALELQGSGQHSADKLLLWSIRTVRA